MDIEGVDYRKVRAAERMRDMKAKYKDLEKAASKVFDAWHDFDEYGCHLSAKALADAVHEMGELLPND